MFGVFVTSLGCLLIGPAIYVNLNCSIIFTCFGVFLIGGGAAFIYNPLIPQLLKISKESMFCKEEKTGG